MSKFFIFARAADDTDRFAYLTWFTTTAAPEFLASVAAHGTIDTVDIAPNFALNLTDHCN